MLALPYVLISPHSTIPAQMDLTEGETCNVDYLDADGLICEYWLTCGVCLENEDPTDWTCQSRHGGKTI